MEASSIVSNYVYEKDDAGLKGGYPLSVDGTSQVGGSAQYGHLAIPIGVVVIREYSVPITQYDEPLSDDHVDDELFEKLLQKVGHREHVTKNSTKKNHREGDKKKSTKKHRH